MKIIALDDERLALANLVKRIKEALPDAEVTAFGSPTEMLEAVEGGLCAYAAFLDIEMTDINGIECAKRLKRLNNNINIIFTTGYTDYALGAFELHASGYVLKPITKEKIERELENLRHPFDSASKELIRVKTFGNFEVFDRNEPLRFRYGKSKELFAYLIDRAGSMASNAEIISRLWEDDAGGRASYLRNLKSDMLEALRAHGFEECVISRRGSLGVDVKKINCDYYRWLEGDPYALNAYNGEYMSQYSWAEATHAALENGRL